MLKRALITLLVFLGYAVVHPGIIPGGVPFVNDVNSTKLNSFQEQEVSISSLRSDPESYFNETVVVSGEPDIAIGKEDAHIVHSYFNRSNKVYFRGCEDVSTTAEQVYVKGEFRNMTEEAFISGENMTEEEKENMRSAEKALERFNYSTKTFESSSFSGVKCQEIIEIDRR